MKLMMKTSSANLETFRKQNKYHHHDKHDFRMNEQIVDLASCESHSDQHIHERHDSCHGCNPLAKLKLDKSMNEIIKNQRINYIKRNERNKSYVLFGVERSSDSNLLFSTELPNSRNSKIVINNPYKNNNLTMPYFDTELKPVVKFKNKSVSGLTAF